MCDAFLCVLFCLFASMLLLVRSLFVFVFLFASVFYCVVFLFVSVFVGGVCCCCFVCLCCVVVCCFNVRVCVCVCVGSRVVHVPLMWFRVSCYIFDFVNVIVLFYVTLSVPCACLHDVDFVSCSFICFSSLCSSLRVLKTKQPGVTHRILRCWTQTLKLKNVHINFKYFGSWTMF